MGQPKAVINKYSGLLGRCIKHALGIPSSPQAFLNFSEFTN
jgi:hypothetical protein